MSRAACCDADSEAPTRGEASGSVGGGAYVALGYDELALFARARPLEAQPAQQREQRVLHAGAVGGRLGGHVARGKVAAHEEREPPDLRQAEDGSRERDAGFEVRAGLRGGCEAEAMAEAEGWGEARWTCSTKKSATKAIDAHAMATRYHSMG